jgi:hypothetical protein
MGNEENCNCQVGYYLVINPMIAPMPMSHDAHQAPKMPAMTAIIISQRAAPVLLTHFEALAPKKPSISIASPHQNEAIAYAGYQTKAKIPSIANPPATIKIILPIIAIAKPIPYDEEPDEVSVSDNYNSPPKRSKFVKLTLEDQQFSSCLARKGFIKGLKICDCLSSNNKNSQASACIPH